MNIELMLCIAFLLAALPVSKSIAAHYLGFTLANVALGGISSADSSLLAMLFATLAMFDAVLVLSGGRKVLLLAAATSAALCIESIMNADWLLSHVTTVSVIVNAAIAVSLAKGYRVWTNGR